MNTRLFKNITVMTILIMITVMLSGCGSTGNSTATTAAASSIAQSTSAPTQETSKEKVTLTVYNWHEERESAYKEIFTDFNKLHPNVEAVYEGKSYDQYYSLISTAIQAGEAPDLFTSHGSKTMYLGQFVKNNACLQLDGLIDTTGYPENCIERAKIDGKLYMSPASFYDTLCVYYNKALFDKYSLKEPNNYDEFINICDTLLKNKVQPIVVAGKSGWDQIFDAVTIITGLAPEWTNDFDSFKAKLSDQRFIDAYKTYIGFGDKGYFGDNYLATDSNGAPVLFQSGKVAMYIGGSWMISYMTENKDVNVGCFYFPTKDGRKVVPFAEDTCTGYSVYSESKHKDEAVALLKYFMEPEALDKIAKIGLSVPALKNITVDHPLLQKLAQIDTPIRVWNDTFTPLAKEGFNALDDLVSFTQKLLYKQMTLDEFVKQMESEIDYSKGQ
jgi:ABC-type sugar transport system, periplasmic component